MPEYVQVAIWQPSPTANTKEAMVMVQQLWSNTSSLLPSDAQPAAEKPFVPRFNLLLGGNFHSPDTNFGFYQCFVFLVNIM